MSYLSRYLTSAELEKFIRDSYYRDKLSLPKMADKFNAIYSANSRPSMFHRFMSDNDMKCRTISEAVSKIYYDGNSYLGNDNVHPRDIPQDKVCLSETCFVRVDWIYSS